MADNLIDYIEPFSPNVRDVFEGFGMVDLIADQLYVIVREFAAVDLHPKVVSGHADDSSESATAARMRADESADKRGRRGWRADD